jgi:hypothetical protein
MASRDASEIYIRLNFRELFIILVKLIDRQYVNVITGEGSPTVHTLGNVLKNITNNLCFIMQTLKYH